MEGESQVSPGTRRIILFIDRVAVFISKHWLAVANVSMFVFVVLPVLAPILMQVGLTGPANVIYTGYHLTCHELAYRTYFFFGKQPVYTIDQLSAMFGHPGSDVFYWGEFIGNSEMGYKMAWCERDAAIYTSILLAGLIYAFIRPRLRAMDWRVYLLVILPMAIDGFWQLFTSPEYFMTFLPLHESDWLLRSITGVLFGVGSAWLIYPHVQQAMQEIQEQASAQYARAIAHGSMNPPSTRSKLG